MSRDEESPTIKRLRSNSVPSTRRQSSDSAAILIGMFQTNHVSIDIILLKLADIAANTTQNRDHEARFVWCDGNETKPRHLIARTVLYCSCAECKTAHIW